MRLQVTLVTTPTADTAGTGIWVDSDRSAYSFGHIPEGYQRSSKYGGIAWTKVNQAHFLSGSVEWEPLGGLPGILLSLAGAGSGMLQSAAETNTQRGSKAKKAQSYDVPIHGADNLSHMLAALRPLVLRQPIKVNLNEHREDPTRTPTQGRESDWTDERIHMWKVPVQRPRSGSPWKRRHATSSTDDHDAEQKAQTSNGKSTAPLLKSRPGPSDPFAAKWIVENGMLDGDLDTEMTLTAK